MDRQTRRKIRLRALRDQYAEARWDLWAAELRLAAATAAEARAKKRAERIKGQIQRLKAGGGNP